MERLAEYYFITSDARAGNVLAKWVPWARSTISFQGNLPVFPGNLYWTGQPNTWTGSPSNNQNLHVTYNGTSSDIGVLSSLAHAFTFWAAKTNDATTQALAKRILDNLFLYYSDNIGISIVEQRPDYCGNLYTEGFNQTVYIPSNWSGNNAQGAQIKPGINFSQMRPSYPQDPKWSYVQNTCAAGGTPQFNYHRFWAEAEAAVANADYARLFPN